MQFANNIVVKAALVILPMLFWFKANAQLLQTPITVNFSEITLEKVLENITQKYQIKFYYSSSVINVKTVINKEFNQVILLEVLQQLFNNTNITFIEDGNRIIIAFAKTPKYTFSGFVYDEKTKESLPGVIIYNAEKTFSVQTNANGFFALTLPNGQHTINFSYVGYNLFSQNINLNQNVNFNILLEPNANLKEVVVESYKDETQYLPNKIEVSTVQLKQVPMIMGETDVIKYLMLMPGIQKGNEGNNGMFVRGGKPDQNLILIDDAIIYNSYHLFGFNSLFTGSELKKVDLYKGGFPASYGGRLSSVLDLSIKDGNKNKVTGEAALGLISSKAMVEGPILNKKASFMLSARRTYFDILTKPMMPPDDVMQYFYYDIHGKFCFNLNKNNKIAISSYFGKDAFANYSKLESYSSDNNLNWGNNMASVKWTTVLSKKVILNTSLTYSNYNLNLKLSDQSDAYVSLTRITSGIRDYSLKSVLDYFISNNHNLKIGSTTINHAFKPTYYSMDNFSGNAGGNSIITINATENAYFIEDNLTLFKKLNLNTGLRFSTFNALNKTYYNLEPRLTIGFTNKYNTNFTFSYAYMVQYMHLLSTFGFGLPTDIWLPVSGNLLPSKANLYTLGASHNFKSGKIKTGIEAYYKHISNLAIYKEGKGIINAIPAGMFSEYSVWEDMVTQGNCYSYGLELYTKIFLKNYNLTVAYTLSKTTKQFNEVNLGRPFNAYFDRRHDIAITQQVKIAKKILFVASWVFGSGYWFTLPEGEYYANIHSPAFGNNFINATEFVQASYISGRNNYQALPYHRLDVSLQYLKPGKWGLSTFELSMYNVYNRQNAFYHTIDVASESDERRVLKQVSLFPLVPSLSYNFKF